MKSLFLSISLMMGATLSAQTTGTLTLAFSQTPHTSYEGTKNVMAVWIESSTGTFVKTRARNAGGGTSDHLAVWAVKAGGSAGNCMAANCNVLGATTGATLSNYGNRNLNISLAWNPAGSGLVEKTPEMLVSVKPNPSANGIFNVEFNYATRISAMNLAGEEVYAVDVKMNEVSKEVDLSSLSSGVYFICVTNGSAVSKNKVVINK